MEILWHTNSALRAHEVGPAGAPELRVSIGRLSLVRGCERRG